MNLMKTTGEIRRDNLERLIAEFGTMEALAAAADTTPVYLSQVRRQAIDVKTGKPRELGTGMARRLEKACDPPKPVGWMDVPAEVVYAPAPAPKVLYVAEPAPVNPGFADRHQVTPSEWGDFQAAKTVLTQREWEEIRERAAQVERAYEGTVDSIKGKR